MRTTALKHKFVNAVPEKLDDGWIYIALDYRTIVHRCCCGCGHEVVTPLSPTDWKLTFDGVAVSLHPSVGNWSLGCRSHYWIDRGAVKWAGQWSDAQVAAGRTHDRLLKAHYYGTDSEEAPLTPQAQPTPLPIRQRFWPRLRAWFGW
jgi:hypothetical protein